MGDTVSSDVLPTNVLPGQNMWICEDSGEIPVSSKSKCGDFAIGIRRFSFENRCMGFYFLTLLDCIEIIVQEGVPGKSERPQMAILSHFLRKLNPRNYTHLPTNLGELSPSTETNRSRQVRSTWLVLELRNWSAKWLQSDPKGEGDQNRTLHKRYTPKISIGRIQLNTSPAGTSARGGLW